MERSLFLLLMGLALVGCKPPSGQRGPDDGRVAAPETDGSPTMRLLDSENRRASAGISEDDIANHDPAVRRYAARALARLGSAAALPLLFKALSDEDGDVVAWAAHGLGYVCRSEGIDGSDIVRGLITRAAALPPDRGASLDPTFAITRALGRCASEEAEKTLEAWLTGPRPRAAFAALALGDVASRRKALSEVSQRSLLVAASAADGGAPLPEGLYPFGRLDQPHTRVTSRLLEAASDRLTQAGPPRIFAIRALSRAGAGAAAELRRVLMSADRFTSAERAEAARGLLRLGDAGQLALAEALPSLVPARDPLASTRLATSVLAPLLATLEALRAAVHPSAAERTLFGLATLTVPREAPPMLTRRVVKLRCRAAALLVNGVADDPLLLQCDPEPAGETGERAQLEVLGRRPIEGRRLSLFRKLLASPHVRVREAAIELLGGHPEVEGAASIIGAALGAREPGVVATAAEFVALHPERVSADADQRTRPVADGAPVFAAILPELTTKLKEALARNWAPDDLETLGSLLEAAGATRLEQALPELEKYCRHANPTLREHSSRALSLLQVPRASCPAPTEGTEGASELHRLVTAPVRLEIVADSGRLELTLDPRHAPVAVTRIVDLAREGFYDGIVVHRVVPGYVVQFGDPGGDGFGGPGRPPLRCETTPAPFERYSVGMALAGRDTGSSQIFVTLARYPHLDQEYTLLGTASADWDAVAEGDIIRQVKVVP